MQSYLRLLNILVIFSIVFYEAWASPQVDLETTAAPKRTDESSDLCINARGLDGKCVSRKRCDYGTDAIDRTLYAPFGFKRPCSSDEVCCPNDYIAPIVEEVPDQIPYDEDK